MSQGVALDLNGKVFPHFTVISKTDKRKSNSVLWECLCECGNTFLAAAGALSQNRIRSCGCNHPNRKEHGISTFNRLCRSYRRHAAARNIPFYLTNENIKYISKQNCFYCDAEPSNVVRAEYNTGDYIYNGIDRVDNTKGYTLDNVVACCAICNSMKSKLPLQKFIEQCRKIADNAERIENVR
jgi:hypothetical protein